MAELDFVERYNRVPVPESLRTIDMAGDVSADSRIVLERTEEFFENIVASFSFTDLARTSLLSINHRMLVPTDGSLRYSDDQMDELSVEGIQPLGTVLRTRDVSNYQLAQFTKYPLRTETIEHIQSVLEGSVALDTILRDSF